MFLNELGLKNKFSNLNSYVICIYYYAYINEIRCVINDNDYCYKNKFILLLNLFQMLNVSLK